MEGCHSLSQAIRVETNATLTTQGDATNPANRLFPKRIVPWDDFPRLQEKVWDKFNTEPVFIAQNLFPSNNQLEYVRGNIRPIYSEDSLRRFERDTVDNIVENIIDILTQDNTLRPKFRLEGRVTFEDRANPEATPEVSLEEGIEQLYVNDPFAQPHRQATGHGRQRAGGRTQGARSARRRNRRADQFCVHVVSDERRIPAYAVEFKAPHKLTMSELIAGLHEMETARDVINKDGDTFEFHATHLVAAVITQLFSYMIDSGVQYGYLCTGEAFIFLHIPEDPTLVYYYLCVPNRDVQVDDEYRLHRTAVGQVLAFTLNALAVAPPSQEWHDAAQEKLSTWKVEYLDVLQGIPPSVRKEPPSSEYKPLSWKPVQRSPYNTRSRTHCQPGRVTPERKSSEGSSSDSDLPSPSVVRSASRRSGRGGRGRGQSSRGQRKPPSSRDSAGETTTRQYCTMKCIRGLATRDRLDPACPNVHEHGTERHSLSPREFTRRLHAQLQYDRKEGFEQLHVCGRTGYLLKATLLRYGYTIVIKATTAQEEHNLRTETASYSRLRPLQGYQIPVCVGHFKPRIAYWYHGQLMAHMMILSWSGARAQKFINQENSSFFHDERDKLVKMLRSYGAVHRDNEWRNILWNSSASCLVMIDFEDVSWIRERPPLGTMSGNIARNHFAHTRKPGHSKQIRQVLSTLPA